MLAAPSTPETAMTPHLTPHHGNPGFAVGPDLCRVLLSGRHTGQALCVLAWHSQGGGGPPLHQHDDQDEVFMVDEGDYAFQVGEARHRLGPGDTIFVPRGVPHSFVALGGSGRLRYLYTPAGRMEDFFEALATLAGPPPPDEAAALFAAHGMRIVGAPLG
jgi:quercetin dioxygenase-like cupin family protein